MRPRMLRSQRERRVWGVLDDELISGVVAAEVHLRPTRHARLVDADDYPAACAQVEQACQLWGGFADLLVPIADAAMTDPYLRLLRDSNVDAAVGLHAADLAPGLTVSPLYHRAPALLALAAVDRDRLRDLEVCAVRQGDPWHLAYLTALGTLPAAPDPQQLAALRLREDLSFDDVARVRRVTAVAPGAADLAKRLRPVDAFTPLDLSLYKLTRRPAGTVHAAPDGWLIDREAFARQHGPDIIVVYTPDSVQDLCLLWNLRALHGWPAGVPLGVPLSSSNGDALAAAADGIAAVLAGAGNGIQGWPVLLVSATVDAGALRQLAENLGRLGQTADPVDVVHVLRPADPPSRAAAATLTFGMGEAIVPTRTAADRQDLRILTQPLTKPDLRLTVLLPQHPLPPSTALRASPRHGFPRFTGGGCTIDASPDQLGTVRWPAGLTLMRAVAHDHGVTAAPSASGLTAMALLRAIGSLDDVAWLAHRPLLTLLYSKASSSGMSWWKRRSTEQAAIVADANTNSAAALEELLAAIENVSVSHGGETAATLTFSEFCQAVGNRDAAASWLEWAERRSLLVRGTTVKCPHCQHEGWRPLAAIAPPIVCPGCATPNDRPFNQTSLTFTYRLGEALRRAIENDSIYHLLAMRLIASILADGPVPFVGAYPGVNFTRGGERTEADVIAVLANGDTIPVEVKQRSTGLRDHDLDLLDKLAGWLDAATVILVTGDDDAQLSATFAAAARCDPLPARRLLTADDWLARRPMITLGTRYPGPDASQNHDGAPRRAAAADHDTEFLQWLRNHSPLDTATDPAGVALRGLS